MVVGHMGSTLNLAQLNQIKVGSAAVYVLGTIDYWEAFDHHWCSHSNISWAETKSRRDRSKRHFDRISQKATTRIAKVCRALSFLSQTNL